MLGFWEMSFQTNSKCWEMLSFETTNKFRTVEKELSQYVTYLRIVEITNFGPPSPDEFSHRIHCKNHFVFKISEVFNRLISFTIKNLTKKTKIKMFLKLNKKNDIKNVILKFCFNGWKWEEFDIEMRKQTSSCCPPNQTQFSTWVRHTQPWSLIVCIGGPGFCNKSFWISQIHS
jgi:hypothetical protein